MWKCFETTCSFFVWNIVRERLLPSSNCHGCVVCIVYVYYAFPASVTLHAIRDSYLPCTVFDRVGVVEFPPSLFFLHLSSSFSPSFPSFLQIETKQQSKQTRLYSDILQGDPLKACNVNRKEIFSSRQQSKHTRLYWDLLQRKLSNVKRCDVNRLCIPRTLHIRHIQSTSAFKPL